MDRNLVLCTLHVQENFVDIEDGWTRYFGHH